MALWSHQPESVRRALLCSRLHITKAHLHPEHLDRELRSSNIKARAQPRGRGPTPSAYSKLTGEEVVLLKSLNSKTVQAQSWSKILKNRYFLGFASYLRHSGVYCELHLQETRSYVGSAGTVRMQDNGLPRIVASKSMLPSCSCLRAGESRQGYVPGPV